MAKRPTPRPVMTERGSRHDPGMTAADEERGTRAPGRSMRPTARPKNKFAEGGMVRGCKPAQTSGKGFSGSF